VRAGADRTDLEIRLDAGAALRVRVVDPEGDPVHGLSVELTASDARERRLGGFRFGGNEVDADQVHEGDDGKYTVTRLESGTFTVRLLPDEREDVEKEDVRLKSGETIDLGTIVAREGRSIAGHVTDAATGPIAAAEIHALWSTAAGMKNRTVRTKADGSYRLAGVGEEPIDMLFVTAKGFARADRRGVVTGDRAVDFILERTGSVVGRVVGPEGGVPAAFRVTAHAEAKRANEGGAGMFRMLGNEGASDVFSDPLGNFRLDGVEPGSYTIEAAAEPFAPAKKAGLQVVSDQVADAGTLTLRVGAALRGRVLDAKDESPVAGASVRVATPSVMPFQAGRNDPAGAVMSAGDGAFAVRGLEPGAYVVTVEHPEFSPSRVRVEIPPDQDPADVVAHLSRGGTLTGTVRDAQRQPLADVNIVLFQGMGQDARTAASGRDGVYSFDKLAPGSYSAMKAPEGGGRMAGFGMKSAVIREGEATVLDFDDAPKLRVHGTVRRGGEPLPDVTLMFLTTVPGDSNLQSAQSDAQGHYEIGLDHGGTYDVALADNGLTRTRGRSSVRVEVPETPDASVDIVLSALGISGRIHDADGKPVVGAFVSARMEPATKDPSGSGAATSDGEGMFRLDGLAPGTYRVSGRANGYRSSEPVTVALAEGAQDAPIDLRLERGSALRGRVVDPGGRGLAGAMVLVAPSSGPGGFASSATASTDFNGTFDLTAPSDGPMDITAIPAGWAPARLTGVTPASSDDAPELVLHASLGGRIQLHVTAAGGQPVAGVQVAIRPASPWPGSEMALTMHRFPPTGTDGATSLDLLAPGAYLISVAGQADAAPVSVEIREGVETTAVLALPK
jgi:protocatechuate 3,4-dioxygenase beta subunit